VLSVIGVRRLLPHVSLFVERFQFGVVIDNLHRGAAFRCDHCPLHRNPRQSGEVGWDKAFAILHRRSVLADEAFRGIRYWNRLGNRLQCSPTAGGLGMQQSLCFTKGFLQNGNNWNSSSQLYA
jgi:hypothetical protein